MNAVAPAISADLPTFDEAPRAPSPTALVRIFLIYVWRHHRLLRIADTLRFTDLVPWRKLFDQDPRQARLADKLVGKDYARRLLGDDWVTPTLWHGESLPDAPIWPGAFVVKSRHGCNQTRFVRTGAENWGAIRGAPPRLTQ